MVSAGFDIVFMILELVYDILLTHPLGDSGITIMSLFVYTIIFSLFVSFLLRLYIDFPGVSKKQKGNKTTTKSTTNKTESSSK